jgi:hypothetical protein
MPICKLCHYDRRLIDAHVIPRAFWQLPGPGEGAAKILSNTTGTFPRRTRIGVYDSSILCAECDGELGKLDQHAAEMLLQNQPTELFHLAELCGRRYEHADTAMIYRFIVSVAWRASISTQPFFRRVRLGPYERSARHVLLEGAYDPDIVCSVNGQKKRCHYWTPTGHASATP